MRAVTWIQYTPFTVTPLVTTFFFGTLTNYNLNVNSHIPYKNLQNSPLCPLIEIFFFFGTSFHIFGLYVLESFFFFPL